MAGPRFRAARSPAKRRRLGTRRPWRQHDTILVGNPVEMGDADCHGWGLFQENAGPLKVGSHAPNRFGLFDMGGDVAEWAADCWYANDADAPTNGTAWPCQNGWAHVLRGGSWRSTPKIVRASDREHHETSVRYPGTGFRIAQSD